MKVEDVRCFLLKLCLPLGKRGLTRELGKKEKKCCTLQDNFHQTHSPLGLSLSLSDSVPGIFFRSIFVFPKCLNPSYAALTLKGHLQASQVFRSLFICSVKFKSSHFLSIVATFPLSSPVCLKSIHHGGSQECSIKVDSCSEVLLQ